MALWKGANSKGHLFHLVAGVTSARQKAIFTFEFALVQDTCFQAEPWVGSA